jgi:tetratricopeptide (TPR) repeat protein
VKSGVIVAGLCGLLLVPFCLAQQSDEAKVFYGEGVQFLDAGKPFDAQEAFTEAVAKDAGYADAYCGLGDAYSRTSRFRLAIEAYTQAIKLRPAYANALYGRGLAHFLSEHYEPARGDFVAAVKADTGKADSVVGFLFRTLDSFRSCLKQD